MDNQTPANSPSLELAIGHQIKEFRKQLKMTVTEVAKQADLSPGMLSKIENGHTSPSLSTLKSLSNALNVPVTSLFRKFEEERDCTYVRSGEGLMINRQGTRAGHNYQLLGHTINKQVTVEPFIITLTEESEVFPIFQHTGVEFLYLLEGKVLYRHANQTHMLNPGDSLFFDADTPHGPEKLVNLPIRMLSIIITPNQNA